MSNSYSPAWWLRGAHAQTLWGKFFRQKRRYHETRVERVETPDGDFLDLHHLDAPPGAPILLLLHGLEGSVRSHYIQGLLGEASRRGWRATALTFRSCGGELNRAPRFYHSGETGDIAFVIDYLLASFPSSSIVAAGSSLGGNVLLKYLGERGTTVLPALAGAVAISVPFDLERSSRHIDVGFSRIYQQSFLRSLRNKAARKLDEFPHLASRASLATVSTMFEFDDCFTAPVHGFLNARDYYSQSSSISWLGTISIPTLLLSAVDDPFLPPEVLEEVRKIARANPAIDVDFPARGGHVGFVSGWNPFNPVYYLERRVGEFLAQQLDDRRSTT
ncbi:MAG: hydrolase [Gemmatimonadaceae bacterium]